MTGSTCANLDDHMITFAPVLSKNGGIKSEFDIKIVNELSKEFTKKLVGKCLFCNILLNTKESILNKFLEDGGWDMLNVWLRDAIQAQDFAILFELLKVFARCPVGLNRLKLNNTPKLLKVVSKSANTKVARTARLLIDEWKKIVAYTVDDNKVVVATIDLNADLSKSKKRRQETNSQDENHENNVQINLKKLKVRDENARNHTLETVAGNNDGKTNDANLINSSLNAGNNDKDNDIDDHNDNTINNNNNVKSNINNNNNQNHNNNNTKGNNINNNITNDTNANDDRIKKDGDHKNVVNKPSKSGSGLKTAKVKLGKARSIGMSSGDGAATSRPGANSISLGKDSARLISPTASAHSSFAMNRPGGERAPIETGIKLIEAKPMPPPVTTSGSSLKHVIKESAGFMDAISSMSNKTPTKKKRKMTTTTTTTGNNANSNANVSNVSINSNSSLTDENLNISINNLDSSMSDTFDNLNDTITADDDQSIKNISNLESSLNDNEMQMHDTMSTPPPQTLSPQSLTLSSPSSPPSSSFPSLIPLSSSLSSNISASMSTPAMVNEPEFLSLCEKPFDPLKTPNRSILSFGKSSRLSTDFGNDSMSELNSSDAQSNQTRRKQIQWAADDRIVKMVYFELDENERCNVYKQGQRDFAESRANDMRLEKNAFTGSRNAAMRTNMMDLQENSKLINYLPWRLIPIDLSGIEISFERGEQSYERKIQAERFKTVLPNIYLPGQQPEAPSEPDQMDTSSPFVSDLNDTPKLIPLEDENNLIRDYSNYELMPINNLPTYSSSSTNDTLNAFPINDPANNVNNYTNPMVSNQSMATSNYANILPSMMNQSNQPASIYNTFGQAPAPSFISSPYTAGSVASNSIPSNTSHTPYGNEFINNTISTPVTNAYNQPINNNYGNNVNMWDNSGWSSVPHSINSMHPPMAHGVGMITQPQLSASSPSSSQVQPSSMSSVATSSASHFAPNGRPMHKTVCKFWAKHGNCKFDTKCNFLHTRPSGSSMSGGHMHFNYHQSFGNSSRVRDKIR